MINIEKIVIILIKEGEIKDKKDREELIKTINTKGFQDKHQNIQSNTKIYKDTRALAIKMKLNQDQNAPQVMGIIEYY